MPLTPPVRSDQPLGDGPPRLAYSTRAIPVPTPPALSIGVGVRRRCCPHRRRNPRGDGRKRILDHDIAKSVTIDVIRSSGVAEWRGVGVGVRRH
jgi:hypothetical protein